eukprot:TRINITY_DN47023_c0_g1_i1.p1 TRINITY_DN47023_c0_g1~~TRINITY_DN47023_c0_g1_i1.p1  ORF type:complete len:360 (-),score=52.59 TRINITY_DN47023_c0_g1_i1:296-1375(-)
MAQSGDGKTVLVTGGTGYVAGHCIQQLLQAGYTVRATVRNTDPERLKYLTSMDPDGSKLSFFKADLLDPPETFEPAVEGCYAVLHVASPYTMKFKDPAKELVEPAEKGSITVLEACRRKGVKKVVVTSSLAAVTDEPEKRFTEEDWNVKSTVKRNPYFYSKVRGEKAAWEFAEKNPDVKVITVLPCYVMGPAHNPKTINPTVQTIVDLFTGKFPAVLELTIPLCDVRDVARAHILAIENDAAKGRYLVCTQCLHLRELPAFYRERCSKKATKKLPKREWTGKMGTGMVKFLSKFQGKANADYMKTHLGKRMDVDGSKLANELELQYTPWQDTLMDTYTDLVAKGHLPSEDGKVQVAEAK